VAATREEAPVRYYARATVGVVLVLIAFSIALLVRNVLVLVLIAAVLAMGLEPAVRFMMRRLKMRRPWAVTTVILIGVGVVILLLVLIVPPFVREIRNFARDIPGFIDRLQNASGLVGDLEARFHLSERLRELAANIPNAISGSFSTIFGVTKSLAATTFNVLTVFVLTIYFMGRLPNIRDGIVALMPAAKRGSYANTLDESIRRISGYVSGNIVISLIAGGVSFVFLIVLGIPFAAALAVIVAFTDLIPTIGAILGMVVCAAVAFFSGVVPGVITLIFFTVYQQVENYVIGPRVMRDAVDLSPIAVVLSVLIGGALLGFVGGLLALPVAAAAKVVIRDLWLRERLEKIRATT